MELYLNLQVVKQRVYRGLKLVDFGKKEVIYQNHGDIIFFDWESDGTSDHVGIVEKCENEKVYTIEGNSNDDMCRQKEYDIFCRSSKCLWTNSCKKEYNR